MSNRITPYEAGWLSMLVRRGICSEHDAREAQNRVACEAVEDLEKRRAAKRARRRKRREE
jgi:hypothetical protein